MLAPAKCSSWQDLQYRDTLTLFCYHKIHMLVEAQTAVKFPSQVHYQVGSNETITAKSYQWRIIIDKMVVKEEPCH
jgi:hypothetical protein